MPNNKNTQPEWLARLQGEYPLLSRESREYIADLRSQIVDEIKGEPEISPDESARVGVRPPVLEVHFMEVVDHLRNSQDHRQYFVKMYPEWFRLRRLNVRELRSIAKSVRETQRNCGIASVGGIVVSLIGGCLSLAGVLRPDFDARWGSRAMLAVGTLTSSSATAAEVFLLRGKIRAATAILEEDVECSRRLWKFMSDGSRLQVALDAVRDVDLGLSSFARILSKQRDSNAAVELIREGLRPFRVVGRHADQVADVVAMLVATHILFDHYRPFFDLAYVSLQCVLQLRVIADAFATASAVQSVLGAGQLSRMVAKNGSGLALGLVLNVFQILLACKDLGAHSRQTEAILEAANALADEAKLFKRFFKQLRRFPSE